MQSRSLNISQHDHSAQVPGIPLENSSAALKFVKHFRDRFMLRPAHEIGFAGEFSSFFLSPFSRLLLSRRSVVTSSLYAIVVCFAFFGWRQWTVCTWNTLRVWTLPSIPAKVGINYRKCVQTIVTYVNEKRRSIGLVESPESRSFIIEWFRQFGIFFWRRTEVVKYKTNSTLNSHRVNKLICLARDSLFGFVRK